MSEPGDSPKCLNCGAELGGQYCGQCGQRATSRFISIWELTRDAFGDLFELDSRLWRTLSPLLLKPGKPTKDYLEGRRARYMPPFRMYLVLSLIFFVVAFFNPREELAIFYEPVSPEESAEEEAAGQLDADDIAAAREEARQAIEELEEQGIEINEGALEAFDKLEERADDDGVVYGYTYDDEDGFESSSSGIDFGDDCTVENMDMENAPEWLTRRLTEDRLVAVCKHWQSVGADGFVKALLDKVPASLIILLPLMALVLKLLYPLSRRYYVEHLLFFVHYHAFFFLILTLQILLARLGSLIGVVEWLFTLTIVIVSFYIPVYLFVAMRRVYGQGRIITFLKYILLVVAYATGFTVVMLGAVISTAFAV